MPDLICLTISLAPAASCRPSAAFFLAAGLRAFGLAAVLARVLLGTHDLRALTGTIPYVVHLHAPLARDLPDGGELAQPVQRGPDHVVRIGRAQRLGEDVGDPGAIEHGAHRTPGDDTGSR